MPRSTSIIGSTLRAATHSRVARSIACAVALACGHVVTVQAATVPGPAIYSVIATPRVAHAGDAVKWDAHVSPDVVSVTARVAVYTFSLYPVRYCHFGEAFLIPKDVPAFFHGKYSVTVTATNAKGESASRSIALRFE